MADDDQSIDDQAETASGGLTNDMPGLPMSPPSGPRPPSALGGLAGSFQRMMGGQRPPQALPQGRSPWQAPGQSQLPVPSGQSQPAQGGPRWGGTTASLFLPKASPQPRAAFTPWMRGPPTTSHMQWGQENDYGQIPQPFENPGLYQNTSKFFGQNGSPAIAMIALSMGKNAGGFIDGIMKGQEWRAKQHREQMIDDATELEIKQQKEMYQYFDTVNEYETTKGVGKAGDIGSYAIKGRTVLDALGQEAMKLGDDKFLAVLSTGSVEKAMQFLHERNNNWQTLKATNKSAQKQEDEDTRKEWGVPESASGGGGTGSQNETFPRPGETTPTPQPGGGPAPQMAGGAPAPPLQQYQEVGNSVLKGETNPNTLPKAVRPAVSGWAAQQGAKIDAIKAAKDAGKLTDEQVPAELEKIIPGMGDDYQSLYTGNSPPTGAAGRSPYWMSLRTLTAPDPIIQQASKRDFATGGRSGTRLTAGTRMSDAAVTVLKEMKNIPEGQMPPANVIDQWISTGVTGDPKWSNLFTALNVYMQEAQSLQSPTGRFFETEMVEQRRNVKLTEGTRAIRGVLKIDAENSAKLVDQLRDNYRRGTREKNDPPTYDPQKIDVLKALSNLDENKGFEGIPPDRLPEELRGLGLGNTGQSEQGGGGGKVHDWREYFQ